MDILQAAPRVESELLGADELLAGAALRFEVEVPAGLLADGGAPGRVRLRPLTVLDLQRITRAARESDQLVAALMVKSAVEAPALSIAQVQAMSIGLLEFLLAEVNRTSGLAMPAAALEEAADAPIARAALVLAQRLGWTPEQIGQLTLGQILLHLQMLHAGAADG
ncbi:MAG: hypothetical protein ABIO45_01790 [Burkholderiaceae bacterium]